MKTIQDKLVAALLLRGETELVSKSRKYRVFTRKPYKTEQPTKFFVGTHGSFRYGTSHAGSRPVFDSERQTLLKSVMP